LAWSESFFASLSNSGRGLSSAAVDEERLWKKLWNVKAPGKVKITLWWLAHDCLPSGHQLCNRRILASDACVFYDQEERAEHTRCSSFNMPWKCGTQWKMNSRSSWDEMTSPCRRHGSLSSWIDWMTNTLSYCDMLASLGTSKYSPQWWED
jgi:hypothetical protein